MSRPKSVIDWKKVNRMLEEGCLGTEVAAYLGVTPETFYDRVKDKFGICFSQYMQEKKSAGDSFLRSKQFQIALEGDKTMLIWLGKQRLKQREPKDNISEKDAQLIVKAISYAELAKKEDDK